MKKYILLLPTLILLTAGCVSTKQVDYSVPFNQLSASVNTLGANITDLTKRIETLEKEKTMDAPLAVPMTTYRNEELGFQIEYPDFMGSVETLENLVPDYRIAFFDKPDQLEFYGEEDFVIEITLMPRGETVSKEETKSLEDMLTNDNLRNASIVSLKNHQALKYDEVGESPIQAIYYTILGDKWQYTVIFAPGFTKYTELIEPVINSFRLL